MGKGRESSQGMKEKGGAGKSETGGILTRPDIVSSALLGIAAVLAPLCGGAFTTPQEMGFIPPAGIIDWLHRIGPALPESLAALAALISIVRETLHPVKVGGGSALMVRSFARPKTPDADSPRTVSMLTLLGGLLAGWAALTLFRAAYVGAGLNMLTAVLASLMAATLASRLSRSRQVFIGLMLSIAAGGALAGGIGVNEYFSYWMQGVPLHRFFAMLPSPSAFTMLFRAQYAYAIHRVFSTFINPDFLAGYLLLTLPVTASLLAACTERSARLLLALAAALQSAALMLSASRTGIIALGAGMLLWGALIYWSGAGRGRRNRAIGTLVIILAAALFASVPAVSRLVKPAYALQPPAFSHPISSKSGVPAAVAKSHSLLFRLYTWSGTLDMIKSNPIFGVGIGNFTTAYPRYEITAFTAHAHNSMLQWASETGLPGLLLLLALPAAMAAFGVNALRLRRSALSAPAGDVNQPFTPIFDEPGLLLIGLLAALFASLMKTMLDSDWYIFATLLTLCLSGGLMTGLARDIAPLTTLNPEPIKKPLLSLFALLGILVLFHAFQVGTAQYYLSEAGIDLSRSNLDGALMMLQSAAQANPFDPEILLKQAELLQASQRSSQELAALHTALRIAPLPKVYYRIGQYYQQQSASNSSFLPQAIASYRKARAGDPKNLQVLRHLAVCLQREGRTQDAIAVYSNMTYLEHEPYGSVRAIGDEVVETEFAYAHSALGDIAAIERNWPEASHQYDQAAAIMRLYWKLRNGSGYILYTDEKKKVLYDLYIHILNGWEHALQMQNISSDSISQELKQVERDYQQDQSRQDKLTGTPS